MKRYSNVMLPPKFSPHRLENFPQIRSNIDTIIEQSKLMDSPLSSTDYKNSVVWLYAIDLFNHGYYWETHGVIEVIWNRFEYESETAQFFQGIIQIAAGLLKLNYKNRKAAKVLIKEGNARIGVSTSFGIDIKKFQSDVTSFVSGKSNNRPVIILQ